MALHARTLRSSPFVSDEEHPLATHAATWWQVDLASGDFSGALVVDTEWDAVNLITYQTGLLFGANVGYKARTKHLDALGEESAWSLPYYFTPRVTASRLYVGTNNGKILQVDSGINDDGMLFNFRSQPDEIAPVGVSAECIFHNLYVTLSNSLPMTALVTPIVNGFELPPVSVPLPARSKPMAQTFEIPLLSRNGIETNQGVRGTWFTARIEVIGVIDEFFAVEPCVLEWDSEWETLPGATFGAADLIPVDVELPFSTFLGSRQGKILHWDDGIDDDGVNVGALAESDTFATAGVDGEAVFHNLYLVVTRNNAAPFEIEIVPVLDDVDMTPIVVGFDAVAAPISEVVELPLYRTNGAINFGMRGTWLALRLTSGELPDGHVIFERLELEHEEVQESKEAVSV